MRDIALDGRSLMLTTGTASLVLSAIMFLCVRVSVGVAAVDAHGENDVEAPLRCAGHMLYAANMTGAIASSQRWPRSTHGQVNGSRRHAL
ncbi:MAG: hypothetical protein P4L92_12350 [Rudaea sp.]|nr:hypothetical protein [Rudaea sp.]